MHFFVAHVVQQKSNQNPSTDAKDFKSFINSDSILLKWLEIIFESFEESPEESKEPSPPSVLPNVSPPFRRVTINSPVIDTQVEIPKLIMEDDR